MNTKVVGLILRLVFLWSGQQLDKKLRNNTYLFMALGVSGAINPAFSVDAS